MFLEVVVWYCSWWDLNKCVFTPWETHETKVQILPKSACWTNEFIRVTYGVWMRGYIQERKCLKDSYITKAHTSTMMVHESQKPEVQCTVSSTVWRGSLAYQVVRSLFHVAQPVSASCKWLASSACLRVALYNLYSLCALGGGRL